LRRGARDQDSDKLSL